MKVEVRQSECIWATIGDGGRIVIPAEYREHLGVSPGDRVMLVLEESGVRITTRRLAMREARKLLREIVPAGVSLSDELLADRRREAALE
jgi:AbrB family looped-hinge helix DNA binding protein